MKLLLINAVNTDNISETVFPNLGLGYLSSFIKHHIGSIDIKIIDSSDQNIHIKKGTFYPDMVGISAVTQNFDYVNLISEVFKKEGIPVFVGGIHISLLPESLPLTCDLGVIGEGEQTVLELIKSFMQNSFNDDILKEIKGIIFRDKGGRLIKTAERKHIERIDELPFPDRDNLNIRKNGFLHIFSSRGCNYRCAFCSNSRFWKKARLFSAEYVLKELREVMTKYSPRAITFYDDDLLIDKKRLNNLASLVDKEGINKKTEFNLMTRADAIDEETVSFLKRMNTTVVSLGLESGCQKTLDFLKCGTSSVKNNAKAIELLNRAGIFTYGFFIIGAPNETEEDILETLNFIRKSRLTGFSIYTLVPYPGTPIWNYAKEKHLVSDSMPWRKLALNISEARDKVVILSEHISRKRLYELYWMFRGIAKRKHRIFMLQRAIRNPKLILPRIYRTISHSFKKENEASLDRKY